MQGLDNTLEIKKFKVFSKYPNVMKQTWQHWICSFQVFNQNLNMVDVLEISKIIIQKPLESGGWMIAIKQNMVSE